MRTALRLSAAAAALALVMGASALPAAPDDAERLVAAGRRLWSTSPDPDDPVACATCHHDPAATRGWAASFPKVKPMPPPYTRVMTLLQANAEAVARHYELRDPLPAAAAITAYLTVRGAGVPISPGVGPGQPVFPARMAALARSVAAGRRLFAGRCAGCHAAALVAPSVAACPRAVPGGAAPLELYLGRHEPGPRPLAWDGQAVADLLAYLASKTAGRPVCADGAAPPKEAP